MLGRSVEGREEEKMCWGGQLRGGRERRCAGEVS